MVVVLLAGSQSALAQESALALGLTPSSASSSVELALLDKRLMELRSEYVRLRIVAPVALTAAVAGLGALSGLMAWFSVHRANKIEHNIEHPNETDCTFCPVEDPDKERAWRRTARVFEGLAVVGATAFAVGLPWLAIQLRRRKLRRREIRELELRRGALVDSLRFGGRIGTGVFGLSLGGRF